MHTLRDPANTTTPDGAALSVRGAYAIYGFSAGYEVNKNLYLRAGIDNPFDKKLYRLDSGTAQGAATYNEPGPCVLRDDDCNVLIATWPRAQVIGRSRGR